MDKPNNPKCNTCSIIRNRLRCWQCKYRTEEWERENMYNILLVAKEDMYKPQESESKHFAELAKAFWQGLQDGLNAESEEGE